MALPSVIAAGGFWIATFTRTVELFGSTAGDIFPDVARSAVTPGSETSASDTRPPSRSPKKMDSVDIEDGVPLAILRQRENRLGRLHDLADFQTSRGNHARRAACSSV